MHSQSAGFVSLVGAGPGDPDLLTRRAVKRLEEADLVLYDALIDPEVLGAGRDRAADLRRQARRPSRSAARNSINRLLIRAARRGRRVVRLKGGDPVRVRPRRRRSAGARRRGHPVRGRARRVVGDRRARSSRAFRSPIAASAAAFVVVSGHAPEAYAPVLATLAPQSATVVVMMGLGSAARSQHC